MSATLPVAHDEARAPGAIAFSGPDAATFLQGQLTCDLRMLTAEGVMLGACLTAQGRVLAILRLIQRPEGLLGLLPRSLAEPVVAHLSRYRLRAKLAIEDLSPRLHFARAFAAGAVAHRLDGSRSRVSLPGGRELWLDTSAITDAPRADQDAWHAAGIAAGDAEVAASSSGEYVPQMLNLDLRDGISFGKGCYTGQEIVARTQHLGRIKRRTLAYRAAGVPIPAGAVVEDDGTSVGAVLESATSGTGSICLAVVSLTAREHALRANGIELAPLALPYEVP
jgi:folate-binding protein YgfZ